MNAKRSLQNRIRGWLPREPLNPNKQMPIKLETNPIKFRHRLGKSPISIAQFVTVIVAVGLILGGLYVNSIHTTKWYTDLPISSTAYHEPFDHEGNNYNCSVYLTVSPPLSGGILGPSNHVSSLVVSLKDPKNITSGVYFVTLQYLFYNDSLNMYSPKETVTSNGTYSVENTKNKNWIFGSGPISPPFEGERQDPLVKDVVFTIHYNATGQVSASGFNIQTPISNATDEQVSTYPYRNMGNVLLTVGVLSLFLALFLSLVNVKRNFKNHPTQENATNKLEMTP